MGYIGNAPYQGVITGDNIQDASIDTADLKDSAVTVGKLASTLDLSGKTVTLPAGVGGHASGTEANRPASPSIGTIYFNTDQDTLQQYTSTGWEDVGTPPPNIGGITGNIYNGVATSLTIAGNGFGTASTVRFTVGGSVTDVSVSNSDTSITVNVPSAIYNLAAATTVSISVIVNGKSTAGSSKTILTAPTGGAIAISGGYRYHTFLSSGTLSIPSGLTLTADALIVAGGGGGGSTYHGGGGGAGGAIDTTVALSSGANYSIEVGLGGPGGPHATSHTGSNGFNSTGFGLTAIGGGGGGGYNDSPGQNGGSGGGGAQTRTSGGLGTVGQGNDGGDAYTGSWAGAGGGGGAGGPGGNGFGTGVAPGSIGGAGGVGINWKSLGTFYAGGGGGSYGFGGSGGAGGNGGGGNGTYNQGANGVENTGGGGGGSERNADEGGSSAFYNGGNGGKGIVIVRYQL